MTGRISLLAFVLACGIVHCLPRLPERGLALMVLALAVLMALTTAAWRIGRGRAAGKTGRSRMLAYYRRIMLPLCAFALGFGLTSLRAEQRLADALAPIHHNQVARVVLQVASLPRLDASRRSFEANVISSVPPGVPSRIWVNWPAPGGAGPYGRGSAPPAEFSDIIPGQQWRMALVMRPPWGPRNPHAFDYEAHLFAQGLRATGTVRGVPRLLRELGGSSLSIAAERARHKVRAAMLPHLEGLRYGAVLLALAIGDQASVAAADWQVFNRSGITHLVSISGSHITMIAALGGATTYALWRRLRWRARALAERWPAQVAGALAALAVAWLYCLLAGWGVPARRTFLMLAVVAASYVLRLPVSSSSVLCLAAFAVMLLDPWAVLASGFWLSFGAVAVLLASRHWKGLAVGRPSPGHAQRIKRFLGTALRLQLTVSLVLTPVLALLFHEVSAVSPLANAYAIPVIGLVVTPLALLCAAVSLLPGLDAVASGLAWLGHGALQLIMVPTAWLAALPAASFPVSAAPLWLVLLALPGVVLALMPYGAPCRHLAWLLLVPGLCWRPDRPPPGGWALHALDVGQAGAIVVQTASHTLLFDTGGRRGPTADDGQRIVIPYLRALGIRRLDTLVVSHADLDHAGGLRSVLAAMPVARAYGSFDLEAFLQREAGRLRAGGLQDALPVAPLPAIRKPCVRGTSWQVDGVHFEFLWPQGKAEAFPGRAGAPGDERLAGKPRKSRNQQSCVLRITGRHHSALLTGDIGERQEETLVLGGLGKTDVVMAAHHGSRTSSSPLLVLATQARHVIAQAGAWNRHGHPERAVENRWRRSGARFWRTDHDGAVMVRSDAAGLSVRSERETSRRYWSSGTGPRTLSGTPELPLSHSAIPPGLAHRKE